MRVGDRARNDGVLGCYCMDRVVIEVFGVNYGRFYGENGIFAGGIRV